MFAASKTASVSGGYQISRSLRFNSADSAYLIRYPATSGSRTTFTFSMWVKRSALSVENRLIGCYTASPLNDFGIAFSGSSNSLYVANYSAPSMNLTTTQVFRDVSAWYHIVVAFDTTQATDTNRVKMYVNGTQVTAFSTATYPTQNSSINFNAGSVGASIGRSDGGTDYLSAYMTEVNFIDGQQLTPSSFGETNAQTGVWQPKAYSGSYGTNGFYLNFSDNSNTTAATLGKDYSGNGNNWTPNNFSVTAGAGNDSLVDSPTSYGTDTGVGGTVRGNYATLNPLVVLGTTAFTNGNLDISVTSANTNNFATIAIPTSGKWYWEYQITTISTAPMGGIIIANASSLLPYSVVYRTNGNKIVDDVQTSYGATYTTTDIIGVAADVDGGTITFYKNGTSQGAITYASGGLFPAVRSNSAPDAFTFNFGQRAFANTAPSGFKALCTQNLPTPTIGATTATTADKFFAPVTFTSSATGSVTISSLGFQPDFTWWKSRATVVDHYLMDVLRGSSTYLASNRTLADQSYSNIWIPSSNGWTSNNASFYNNDSNVAWNWKANGSGSTNTSGTITSTVSANTTAGFSVVTYTGNGTFGSVGHGLGVAPSMVIIKTRNNVYDWLVYHKSLGFLKTLFLNLTSAAVTATEINNSSSTTMTVQSEACTASNNYVAYCFAEIEGYSKFGSYTGNGSADGPFVFTGMRPAYVMIKRTDATASWYVLDMARNTYNAANLNLYPNLSNAEATFSALDILSNGFKIRNSDNDFNASGGTYIYACFASNPFKYSLAR